MSWEKCVQSTRPATANALKTFGFVSPFLAAVKMEQAISALIADVRLGSGSAAVASSRTVFINWMRSGEKTAPPGFMFGPSTKENPALLKSSSRSFEPATNFAQFRHDDALNNLVQSWCHN